MNAKKLLRSLGKAVAIFSAALSIAIAIGAALYGIICAVSYTFGGWGVIVIVAVGIIIYLTAAIYFDKNETKGNQ